MEPWIVIATLATMVIILIVVLSRLSGIALQITAQTTCIQSIKDQIKNECVSLSVFDRKIKEIWDEFPPRPPRSWPTKSP